MQLIKFCVSNGIETFRTITFKDGMNIITNEGEDGNQIGKSTALRSLNFCLGSDGMSIWRDPDSKNINDKIYNLVTNGSLVFKLELKVNGIKYIIKRTIEQKMTRRGVQLVRNSWINDEPYKGVESFKKGIASVFGYTVEKPKYNSVKNRFVRLDKTTANRTYRFENMYTSDDDYILIYSHLFGFEGHKELTREIELEQENQGLQNRIDLLLNNQKEQYYLDKLKAIDDEIEILRLKEDSYDITGIQNKTIEKLRFHRSAIAKYSSEISSIETKIIYNTRTIDNYNAKVENIDIETIKSIYEEALTLIPNITRTLEEAIEFHNSVFTKKAEYVSKQVLTLDEELKLKKKLLNQELNMEKELIKLISNESHLSGFILIEKEIQDKKEERGKAAFVVEEIADIRVQIKNNGKEISALKIKIEQFSEELEKNIILFNTYCKAITKKVFKTFSLQLSSRIDDNGCLKFSVVNEVKVAGDGAPRAASMAFDFAMVEYVKASKAKLPEFTIQDYLEPTDEDKLFELIKISNEYKTQTVISVLNDKLHLLDADTLFKNTVLELSPSNKFFKI